MIRYIRSKVEEPITYKKEFTIVAGINGVGKSTMVGLLKSNPNSFGTIIDPDDYAKKYGGNLSGGKEAIKDIDYCIDNGIAFTEETTLSGKHIISTAKKAKENGYTINLIYVGLDTVQDSIDRVTNRVKHGGHDIPADLILRRYEHRFEQLDKILKYCNTAKFYDNTNGYALVATYANDTITQEVEDAPKWLSDFYEYLGI